MILISLLPLFVLFTFLLTCSFLLRVNIKQLLLPRGVYSCARLPIDRTISLVFGHAVRCGGYQGTSPLILSHTPIMLSHPLYIPFLTHPLSHILSNPPPIIGPMGAKPCRTNHRGSPFLCWLRHPHHRQMAPRPPLSSFFTHSTWVRFLRRVSQRRQLLFQ